MTEQEQIQHALDELAIILGVKGEQDVISAELDRILLALNQYGGGRGWRDRNTWQVYGEAEGVCSRTDNNRQSAQFLGYRLDAAYTIAVGIAAVEKLRAERDVIREQIGRIDP